MSTNWTKYTRITHLIELVVVDDDEGERDDGGKRKRTKAVQAWESRARLGARESAPKKDGEKLNNRRAQAPR